MDHTRFTAPRCAAAPVFPAALVAMATLAWTAAACDEADRSATMKEHERNMDLTLTSTAFEPGGPIPREHTCDGDDASPPLSWSGLPEGTRSLALVVDDPDAPDPAAPKRVWVHWVLYDIPPTASRLPGHVTAAGLPAGTREGLNDWRRTGYGGPCPPKGRHRYFHKLYALDTVLEKLEQPTKNQLLKAMAGHVLAQVELIGTYQRQE